jgi:putative MATE family efflux protein
MARSSKKIDMLSGSLWDKLIVFALPVAFTGIFQQLFNTADVIVLGRFVSKEAMAAVGNNVPLIGLIISFCMGLALGANVVIARALGRRDAEEAGRGVHTAFALALIFGTAMMILGELIAAPMAELLGVPESVMDPAVSYLRGFFVGLPFIAVYNFLAAAYRSQGDTQTPLWALVMASVINAALDLFFVLVLGFGAGAVALATSIANLSAALFLFIKLLRIEGPLHLYVNRLFDIDRTALRTMVRIGWPAGLQGAVFSLSNLIIQSAINSLGPDVMAGSVAAFTIEINVYCFINAFGLACTTFVSQNYGAGQFERSRHVTRVATGLNVIATVLMVALVLAFGHQLLGFFSSSKEVIELGFVRLLWVVSAEPINVILEMLSGALRAYGCSMPPAILMLVAICGVRIAYVFTVFAANPTYSTLMAVYPLSWVVAAIGLIILYRRFIRKLAFRIRARKEEKLAAAAED